MSDEEIARKTLVSKYDAPRDVPVVDYDIDLVSAGRAAERERWEAYLRSVCADLEPLADAYQSKHCPYTVFDVIDGIRKEIDHD